MTNDTVPARTYTLDPARTTIRCDCKSMMGLVPVHGTFDLIDAQKNPAGMENIAETF